MALSTSDAAAIGAVCTMLGLIAQALINQAGAERARKHELEMARLKLEEEQSEIESAVEAAQKSHAPDSKARVLVVDDEVDHLALMLLHLSRLGYEPSGAASGEEALVVLAKAQREKRPFALVLLDQAMPGISGDTVASYIRANNGFLKIVFVTAHAKRQGGRREGVPVLDGKTAAELGALAIWMKPLDFEAFPAMIEEILKD